MVEPTKTFFTPAWSSFSPRAWNCWPIQLVTCSGRVNKGKEFVGRHDDHDAEDDQHGECTGDADDFCLHGSADKYLETRAEQSSHHVHEDDGGEESADHKRRTNNDAEQQEVAPFAVLSRSAVPFGQGMGTEPERGRDQGLHHQNDPAHES